MSSFDVLFPIPTGGRNADDMGMPLNWPPRFTFTPEGIAGLFLRKHFSTASGEHQQELAGLLRECVEQEREACAKACESLQVNKSRDYYPGQAFDGACRTCAEEIRKRSNAAAVARKPPPAGGSESTPTRKAIR